MPTGSDLTRNMPVAEAVRQSLLRQNEEIRRQGQLILAEDLRVSADAVHDLRVAIRRSQAVLAGFSPWLNPGWQAPCIKIYRRLIRRTSRLRDLDVLSDWADQLPEDIWAKESSFRRHLQEERCEARQKLQKLLQSRKFTGKMAEMTASLLQPESVLQMSLPPITGSGRVHMYRLADCLPVFLYSAAADLTAYHAAIPGAGSLPDAFHQDETVSLANQHLPTAILHRLRVTAKVFRYRAEAVQSVLDPPAAQILIREFRQLQDLLGSWHDAVVAAEHLERDFLTDQPNAAAAALIQDWQQKRQDLEKAFSQLWPQMQADWFHERISACLWGS